MPKLSNEQRARINNVLAIHKRIMDSFEGKHYTSQCCRFCNWASNGRTIQEAVEAKKAHESSHPEQAEYDGNVLSVEEIQASFHDHDCVMVSCTCKCGCREGPFCSLAFGPLCSVCEIREGRGDSEHGSPD